MSTQHVEGVQRWTLEFASVLAEAQKERDEEARIAKQRWELAEKERRDRDYAEKQLADLYLQLERLPPILTGLHNGPGPDRDVRYQDAWRAGVADANELLRESLPVLKQQRVEGGEERCQKCGGPVGLVWWCHDELLWEKVTGHPKPAGSRESAAGHFCISCFDAAARKVCPWLEWAPLNLRHLQSDAEETISAELRNPTQPDQASGPRDDDGDEGVSPDDSPDGDAKHDGEASPGIGVAARAPGRATESTSPDAGVQREAKARGQADPHLIYRLLGEAARLKVREADCGVCGVPAVIWIYVCEGYSVPRCGHHRDAPAYQAESRLYSLLSLVQPDLVEEEGQG
jgi:hypothetical protein